MTYDLAAEQELILSYTATDCILVNNSAISELYYHITFLIIRVSPDKKNKLNEFDGYLQDSKLKDNDDLKSSKLKEYEKKKYIVFEAGFDNEFKLLIDTMKKCSHWNALFENGKLNIGQRMDKWVTLVKYVRQHEIKSMNEKLARNEDDQVFVYPFEASHKEFDGLLNKLQIVRDNGEIVGTQDEKVMNENLRWSPGRGKCTITEINLMRLAENDHLDDALINFWIEWLVIIIFLFGCCTNYCVQ